jgi:hypothetical protein
LTASRVCRAATTLAALAAMALGGCGGDDETTGTTTGANGGEEPALSDATFVQQANAICEAGNKSTEKLANSTFTGRKPSRAQLDAYAKVAVPAIQTQIDAIRALPAPEDLEDQVTEFLDTAEEDLSKVEADPSLFVAGDTDPFANTNRLASDLGLDQCGSSG